MRKKKLGYEDNHIWRSASERCVRGIGRRGVTSRLRDAISVWRTSHGHWPVPSPRRPITLSRHSRSRWRAHLSPRAHYCISPFPPGPRPPAGPWPDRSVVVFVFDRIITIRLLLLYYYSRRTAVTRSRELSAKSGHSFCRTLFVFTRRHRRSRNVIRNKHRVHPLNREREPAHPPPTHSTVII